MNNIQHIKVDEHAVIEMLEAGVEPDEIAKLLNISKDIVLDIEDYACENRDCGSEDEDEDYDGQPDEYTEWQDYMGGDDWDHGQYDSEY
jgi:hypothetical protein